MQFFDTHAHYFDGRFHDEYPGGSSAAILNAYNAGATAILNAGTTPDTSAMAVAIAEKYPFCYAAVGLHPTDSSLYKDDQLDGVFDKLANLACHPKVVAIGEIGLDYHWEPYDKARQQRILEFQLEFAETINLPVIIHDREAHSDCFDIVRRHKNVRGVFHSFSGSAEMARQLTDAGWYISFSGPVTYKNSRSVKEAVAVVPHDRILVETDAPYLPPVPHRGKLNTSAYLPFTIAAVSDILMMTPEDVAELTYRNAKTLFSL